MKSAKSDQDQVISFYQVLSAFGIAIYVVFLFSYLCVQTSFLAAIILFIPVFALTAYLAGWMIAIISMFLTIIIVIIRKFYQCKLRI